MSVYKYFNLREKPEIKEAAANWFHDKWGVPTEAYQECIDAYVGGATEYGWYVCLDGEKIVGGLGVIENVFMTEKTLRLMSVLFTQKRDIDAGVFPGSY